METLSEQCHYVVAPSRQEIEVDNGVGASAAGTLNLQSKWERHKLVHTECADFETIEAHIHLSSPEQHISSAPIPLLRTSPFLDSSSEAAICTHSNFRVIVADTGEINCISPIQNAIMM